MRDDLALIAAVNKDLSSGVTIGEVYGRVARAFDVPRIAVVEAWLGWSNQRFGIAHDYPRTVPWRR